MAIGGEADPSGELVLIGFPSATLDKKEMRITGRPTSIITALMHHIPVDATPPVEPTLDLFLQLPREAIAQAGVIVDIPPIQGISGCAIWQLRETGDDELWSPERALRLVGVQSSARAGSYFRGKRWAYIRSLLAQAA